MTPLDALLEARRRGPYDPGSPNRVVIKARPTLLAHYWHTSTKNERPFTDRSFRNHLWWIIEIRAGSQILKRFGPMQQVSPALW